VTNKNSGTKYRPGTPATVVVNMKWLHDVKYFTSFQNWKTWSRNQLHYLVYKRLSVQNKYISSITSGEQVYFLYHWSYLPWIWQKHCIIVPTYEHVCVSVFPPFNLQTKWQNFTKTQFKRTVRWNNATLKVVKSPIST